MIRVGVPKGELAEADHRKPVHLTDLSAIGLDMDGLAADFFLQATIDAVAAAELRVDRRLHLGLADHVFAAVGGDLVGFLQQSDERRAYCSTICRNQLRAGTPAR